MVLQVIETEVNWELHELDPRHNVHCLTNPIIAFVISSELKALGYQVPYNNIGIIAENKVFAYCGNTLLHVVICGQTYRLLKEKIKEKNIKKFMEKDTMNPWLRAFKMALGIYPPAYHD